MQMEYAKQKALMELSLKMGSGKNMRREELEYLAGVVGLEGYEGEGREEEDDEEGVFAQGEKFNAIIANIFFNEEEADQDSKCENSDSSGLIAG